MPRHNNSHLSPLEASKNSSRFVYEEVMKESPFEGWILHVHRRSNGKKHIDRYWFSPKKGKKFRSRVEIQQFREILDEIGSDKEDEAWDRFQQSRGKRGSRKKPAQTTKKNSNRGAISSGYNQLDSNFTTTNSTEKINQKSKVEKVLNSHFCKSDGTMCLWNEDDYYSSYSSESDFEDELPVSKLEMPKYSREFSFRQRKQHFNIQEAKQVSLTPEEKDEILFADAIITAVDELEYRKKTTDPDPYSAFNFQGNPAEPKVKDDGVIFPKKPKRRIKRKPILNEAKLSKIQKYTLNTLEDQQKFIAEKKC